MQTSPHTPPGKGMKHAPLHPAPLTSPQRAPGRANLTARLLQRWQRQHDAQRQRAWGSVEQMRSAATQAHQRRHQRELVYTLLIFVVVLADVVLLSLLLQGALF